MNAHPLQAANYADHAVQQTVRIVKNEQIARDTYRLRFECPEIAGRVRPGQFLMIRLEGAGDPMLGRALAMYDTADGAEGQPAMVDVVYLVVGKLTSKLANCSPSERLVVWGPLGNGFSVEPVDHLIMVAGGIGQTPFVALARQMLGDKSYGECNPPLEQSGGEGNGPASRRVTLCYGARTADYLAGLDDFEQAGVALQISTDDGSRGHHGLVTDLLKQQLAAGDADGSRRIVCCGPEPMMEAVAKIALAAGVPCQVSLETPMACGIGICFSCVVGVVEESDNAEESCGWDYKRTCVEGPIFDAAKIRW